MCLYIDAVVHSYETTRSSGSKVAKFPIIVYKALRSYKNKLISPYQYHEYKFRKLYTSSMSRRGNVYHSNIVEKGLHACLNESAAYKHSGNVFPALIPVGSRFYLGNRDDIASNQLIVFNDMKDLLQYCGVSEANPAVSRYRL